MTWKERWSRDSEWIVAAIALVILSILLFLVAVSYDRARDQREKAFEKRLIEGITTAITAVRGEKNE